MAGDYLQHNRPSCTAISGFHLENLSRGGKMGICRSMGGGKAICPTVRNIGGSGGPLPENFGI